jgi:phosphohistidine swiveling domain-containing protein
MMVDLVVLNEQSSGYLQSLHEQITAAMFESGDSAVGEQPGGVFIRRRDQIAAPDLLMLRGTARVIRDLSGAANVAGCILVAERTDPGWGPLFPLAKGVLVERGSVLSHAAILTRELGIPCVVGVNGLLSAVRDGDTVELDGAAGTVRVIGKENP